MSLVDEIENDPTIPEEMKAGMYPGLHELRKAELHNLDAYDFEADAMYEQLEKERGMEGTLILKDNAAGHSGQSPIRIEGDEWGLSIRLFNGEEFYFELHQGSLVLRHFKNEDDENPGVTMSWKNTPTVKRIVDENGYPWLWDTEASWLDIEYTEGDEKEEGSGFPAATAEDVVEVMLQGGFFRSRAQAVAALKKAGVVV